MLVNETKNDVEINVRASVYATRKIRILSSVIFGALFVLVGVAFLLLGEVDLFFPIFLFVLAAAELSIFLIFFKALVRHGVKKMMAGKESVNEYTFREDDFEVKTTGGDGIEGVSTVAYASLVRIDEYADLWILTYNRATMFAVDKSGMKEGTAEDLSVFLGVKKGSDYHIRYRRR